MVGLYSTRWWFAGIFLVALILRWGYSLGLEEKVYWDDAVFLDQTAQNWVAGKGMTQKPLHDTVADKEPVYPFFLGMAYWTFGHGFLVPRMAQGLFGALTAVLIALLGTKLGDARVGYLAGSIAAVYPYFVFYNGMILSETLFMLWLVVLAMLFERLRETASFGHAAAAGVVLGVATLTKASLMFYIPIAGALAAMIVSGRVRRKVLLGVAVIVLAAATIMPWTLRNYQMLGAFVPVRTGGGQFLFESCNPIADGGPWRGGKMDLPGVAEAERLPELEKDRAYLRMALTFMRENPGRMAELGLVKLQRFWNVVPNVREARGENYGTSLLRILSAATVAPVLALGVIGLIVVARSGAWRVWIFPLSIIAYYTALHTVFLGSIRYRDPLMPFVILFAACGTVQLLGRVRRGTPA